MHPKANSKKTDDKKTIDELEKDLASLQKKIKQQTNDVKNLLKDRIPEKSPTNIEISAANILESELINYNLEQLQAEFFASIATLEILISNYQQNRFDIQTYDKQLNAILNDIYKLKLLLEKKESNISEFIRRENILEKFTKASEKLREIGFIL